MRRIITLLSLLICVFIMGLTGCTEPTLNDDTTVGEPVMEDAGDVVEPIYSAVVDRIPTEEEIMSGLGRASSIPPLKAGEKLVQIWAKTCDEKYAGTDDPAYFSTQWYEPLPLYRQKKFHLDNPKRDDNNRGAYNYFIYHFTTEIERDILCGGFVSMKGTDGWKCEFIQIVEEDFKGRSRYNKLQFDAWMDNDGRSKYVAANNRTFLIYR